jgi:cell pole-organizing protein PopZ
MILHPIPLGLPERAGLSWLAPEGPERLSLREAQFDSAAGDDERGLVRRSWSSPQVGAAQGAWDKASEKGQGGGMSVIDSNSDDRDHESLRRAQRAYEPSMEEILASIRNIIADDREPAKSAAEKAAPQRSAAATSGPQIVYSKDAPAPQRLAPGPPERGEAAPETNAQKAASRQSERANSEFPVAAVPSEEEPLLSPETDKAVTLSFGALSANLAMRSAELAEGMVREMLRPMLKQWLDENLPSIVERLVQAEIERVARGPR